MNQRTFFTRIATTLTAFFVAFSSIPVFPNSATIDSQAIRVPTSLTTLVSAAPQISSELGRVESFHSGSGPTIIHIQTAHGNYEAQKKIESILNVLEKEQGITTILVEGSWETLYPEILNFFPENPKQTQELNDLLTRKAVVQGPELYLLNSKKAQGFGIEEEQSYLQNAADFAAVVKVRKESRKFLIAAMDGIEKIASAYLGRELRDFLRRDEAFQNGIVSLQDWLQELKRQVQINYSEDLSDLGFEQEWPNLVRFYQIQKNEKIFDQSKFEKEKKEFLKDLQKNDSQSSMVYSPSSVLGTRLTAMEGYAVY